MVASCGKRGLTVGFEIHSKAQTQQSLRNRTRARPVEVKISQLRSGQTPQITIDAVLAPSCLVTIGMRTAPNPAQNTLNRVFGKRGYLVKYLGYLAKRDMHPIQALQQPLYRPLGHPFGYRKRRNQTHQPRTYALLADHTVRYTKLGNIDLYAIPRTPCKQVL